MLIRISLIIAILAGLGVAGIALFPLKQEINDTITARNDFHDKLRAEEKAHNATKKTLNDTQEKLKTTTTQLTVAKADATAARAAAEDAEKKQEAAEASLKNTQKDLQDTKDKLAAWDSLNVPIQQVRDTINSVRRVNEEKAALEAEKNIIYAKTQKLMGELAEIKGPVSDPDLPDDLVGKVLAVDPKYDFVVLNFGSQQGALSRGKLLVERNGTYVAKLVITDQIQSNKCIANVMPGYRLSDVMEGDQVFP